MTTISGSAQAHHGTISVSTFPGGALSELSLDEAALTLGPATLADTILELVREATAVANQRTKHALRDSLSGLRPEQIGALGLDQDDLLTERAESTIPDTWRTT